MASSVDELRRHILEEAKRKADEILADARKKAQEIIEAARSSWKKRYDEVYRNKIEKARVEANAIIAEASRMARLKLIDAKNKVINDVFREVEKLLIDRRNFDAKESLKNLLDEALKTISGMSSRFIIYVNPRDKNIIESIIKELKLNCEIRASNDIIGGLILETPDGVRVDNSYDERLMRAREAIVNKLARILWG